MDVVAVCRSQKRMRSKVVSVLDRYLYRIGDRTWRGRASMECLKRISKDLKKHASRNMAVALYRDGAKEAHRRPLFIVGSRSRFAADGKCPVATRKLIARHSAPPAEDSLLSLIEIAALFHDVGKASKLFQSKLRAVISSGKPLADAVRHEMISALLVAELLPIASSDAATIAARMSDIADDPSLIDAAWARAALISLEAHRSGTQDYEVFTRAGSETRAALGDPASLRAQIILLVLSHHRLPEGNHFAGTITAEAHIDPARDLTRDDLEITPGTPFWHEAWFADRLRIAASRLSACTLVPSAGLDAWARTALMSADHIGSSKSEVSSTEGHIANLRSDPPMQADTLLRHTQRVTRTVRPMTIGPLRHSWSCPSVSADTAPPLVARPRITGSRFDWQAFAANAAAELVAEKPGGFFATLIAGTGAGKTRGAASVLAGAALNDHDEKRRGLRYNLALPLRSLASQSGREYVEDLGFSSADVTTMVGGQKISWIDDAAGIEPASEALGSQDRFPEALPLEDIDDQDLAIKLSTLHDDCDRQLPLYLQQVCEAARDTGLEKFLSTPIISATIDHFMPVAAPLRSFHLAATHRVMTADLVIDELDLLEDEDLSAVKRLVRIAALGGRRVVIMSATLPADVAQNFYDIYCEAYQAYAALVGCAPDVHHLCAGDAADAVASSKTGASFGESIEACKGAMETAREQAPCIQMAQILPRATDWPDQVDIIKKAAARLHREHSIMIDGKRVSVGLIRMTRIKHLQALALRMAEADDGCHYILLHSAMPRLVRENIERSLKRALTRKGSDPQAGLRDFLRSKGLLAKDASEDVRIIVFASPVIETGNDVDCDWLITDPSSTRSIIQAAGRVNRHRRAPVNSPNVLILGDYAVYRQARSGGREAFMEMPGVESKPHGATDVSRLRITGSHAIVDLLGREGQFRIDAGLAADGTALARFETDLRSRFASVCRNDFERALFWWVKRVALRHRFRRPAGLSVDAFPVVGDEEGWVAFLGRHREHQKMRVRTLERSGFEGVSLFQDTLFDLLPNVRGARTDAPFFGSPLSLRISSEADISGEFSLDPILGLVGEKGHVTDLTFADLR